MDRRHLHTIGRFHAALVFALTVLCCLPHPVLALDCEEQCRALCEAGDAPSCARLAEVLLDGLPEGGSAAVSKAEELLKMACDASLGYACNRLGMLTEVRSRFEPLDYYERACQSDSASGCFNVGRLATFGDGTRFFKKACDLGDDDGCMMVAAAYLDGTGVDVDAARAERLYSELCGRSHPISCYVLGLLAEERGEAERSKELLGRACELGATEACQ